MYKVMALNVAKKYKYQNMFKSRCIYIVFHSIFFTLNFMHVKKGCNLAPMKT